MKHAFYKLGAEKALQDAGIAPAEEEKSPVDGKETRLKRNHESDQFFNLRRSFERADVKKKEVGKHVPQEH